MDIKKEFEKWYELPPDRSVIITAGEKTIDTFNQIFNEGIWHQIRNYNTPTGQLSKKDLRKLLDKFNKQK